MEISDEILDEAYPIYEEFGPDRRIDRRERLAGVFPQLSSAEIETLADRMAKVSETVWRIAEKGGETKLGKDAVERLLQQEHPFLKNKGLNEAAFLVNYYAWHEGYDK